MEINSETNEVVDELLPLSTPGEILRSEFMEPAGISEEALAQALCLPNDLVCALVAGQQPITTRLAARLGNHFGTSPMFWLNLQADHEQRDALTNHETTN